MLAQWVFGFFIINVSFGCSQMLFSRGEDYKLKSILPDNNSKPSSYAQTDQDTQSTRASKKPALRKKNTVQSAIAHAAVKDSLVILLYDREGVYAYPGAIIQAGRRYTYPEFRKLLDQKKLNKNLSVTIKPCVKCTYKNTVSMVDELKKAGITKFALVDVTKAEEDYLRKLP